MVRCVSHTSHEMIGWGGLGGIPASSSNLWVPDVFSFVFTSSRVGMPVMGVKDNCCDLSMRQVDISYMFWVTTTGCGIWVGQWLHVCCCSIFMWVIAVSQEPLICSLLELLSFRSSGLVGLQSGNTLCLGGGKMEENRRIFCVIWRFLVPWFTENGKKKNSQLSRIVGCPLLIGPGVDA